MIVFQSNVIKVKKKTFTRYIGVARIFNWRAKPQITRNDVIEFFRKEELYMEQRYLKMEEEKSGPGLAYNLDFAKGKDLNQKFRFFQIVQVGRHGEQISLIQTYHRLGSGGRPLGDFL